jgi:DTW domain-containing protein YfiP
MHDTKLHVLMLQHPQEPGQELGTAELAHRCLPNSTLRVGLSWRNLAAALGREDPVDSRRWAVLYWGSGPKGEVRPGQVLCFVDKKGVPVGDDTGCRDLEGVVLLDGTWSQAKALWWRNAWLLKLRRALLIPSRPSLYGKRRREPRRECLSTIEAMAHALVALGERPELEGALTEAFSRFLADKAGQCRG